MDDHSHLAASSAFSRNRVKGLFFSGLGSGSAYKYFSECFNHVIDDWWFLYLRILVLISKEKNSSCYWLAMRNLKEFIAVWNVRGVKSSQCHCQWFCAKCSFRMTLHKKRSLVDVIQFKQIKISSRTILPVGGMEVCQCKWLLWIYKFRWFYSVLFVPSTDAATRISSNVFVSDHVFTLTPAKILCLPTFNFKL